MASGHPRDSTGRVLPHPWWPADRQAAGELEFVRRFCNSINRENGAERFHDPAALDAWLATEGAAPVRAGVDDLRRVVAVREVLHDLVVANTERDDGTGDAWARLAELLGPVRLGLVARDAGLHVGLHPTDTGRRVDALLGRLGLAIAAAVRDGSWSRLKACSHCHWVVHDPSKNRSSRWCSMSACGGRHNAREYRRRHSTAG